MIIGLCGTSIEGRSEISAYLINKGFTYYSILTMVEQELKGKSTPQKIAAQYHKQLKKNKDYWIKLILKAFSEENAVIDGVLNRAEVKALRSRQQFSLIDIYSPEEVKYERSVILDLIKQDPRLRKSEKAHLEVIEELSAVMKESDYSIVYPLSATSLKFKLEDILRKTSKKRS